MNNEKFRIILAAVLCFVIFILQQIFFPPARKPVAENVPAVAVVSDTITPAVSVMDVEKANEANVLLEPIVIDKQNFTVGFNPDTGNIRFVKMKTFAKDEGDEIPQFEDPFHKADYAEIYAGIASGYRYTVVETGRSTIVTFEANNNMIAVRKSYTISDNDSKVPVNISIQNLTSSPLSVPLTASVGPYLGSGFDKSSYVFTGPMVGDGSKVVKKKMKFDGNYLKKTKPAVLASPKWGGYTSKYFLLGFMGGNFEVAEIDPDSKVVLSGNVTVPVEHIYEIDDFSLYMGPKIYDTLKSYQNGIQKTVEYGMFSFLAIPMTKILQQTFKYVGNYGVAIIILTFIVKILTLPLTIKSTMSMRGMSKLQPEIAKLKEKYKEDPQKLQAATMQMYKEHKINPMGGCLPLLIQFPIFIALYRTLLVSIELKGAPFFGWLVDLSARDPYYITPILMGASMFISQKMTPSTGDPTQQKMLMFMPIVFTFLFMNMPSGLVIYWLTSNILTIFQQYIMNKKLN